MRGGAGRPLGGGACLTPVVIQVCAAAGIPVTHRGVASVFHVFTAHDRNDALADIDFAALVKAGGTCVFLMGLSLVGEIAARFASAGAAPVTPVAVISRATLPEQREVRGTLADIAARVGEAGLVSPAVIVVGGVVEACPCGGSCRGAGTPSPRQPRACVRKETRLSR